MCCQANKDVRLLSDNEDSATTFGFFQIGNQSHCLPVVDRTLPFHSRPKTSAKVIIIPTLESLNSKDAILPHISPNEIEQVKILIIDDDQLFAATIKGQLEYQNYEVDIAADEQNGLTLLETKYYDVVLLDLMLSGFRGVSVCERIRKAGNSTAIIFLTTRSEKFIEIKCLDAGADDYLIKPIDPDELSARIRALMRRGPVANRKCDCQFGVLTINTASYTVKYGNSLIKLTPTEYRLLLFLANNSSQFFKADELVEKLWTNHKIASTDAIKTHIKTLRKKLRTAGIEEEVIESVYGYGYRFKDKSTDVS